MFYCLNILLFFFFFHNQFVFVIRLSYDPELDRWFLVQPMHAKRLGVGVVVVNRLLYALAGFNGTDRLASVECYHPENNEWSFVPPMTCGRSGAGVAAINQYIYVVGGFDGVRQLSSVERYDTENQVWEQVAPIKIARSALSLTSLDGKLYAIGGFDGTSFLSIVEVYDPKMNFWEQGTPLSSGRSGHASAVIYQPSCATNFMDCIEDETSKRGGGPRSNDSRSDDNSSDQQSGSRGVDSSVGGSNSFTGFHTSYGSSGCRNCENEIVPSAGENTVEIGTSKAKNITITPLKDIPYKKLRNRWCKKLCKLKTEFSNVTEEETTPPPPPSTSYTTSSLASLTPQPTSTNTGSETIRSDNSTNITTLPIPPPNVKRKCYLSQCKSKCLIQAIRNCNARNVLQEFLNSILEKRSKKFIAL